MTGMSKPKFFKHVFLFFIGLFALLYIGFRLYLTPFYSTSIGGLESNVIYGVQKLLAGLPLYTDPTAGNGDLIQKGPLYYYLIAALCTVIQGADAEPIILFWVSRIVSLFLCLGIGYMLYRLLQQLGVDWTLAIGISLLLLVSLTDHYHSRMDPLYLFLFVISSLYFLRIQEQSRGHYLWLGVLLGLTCMSKQTGVFLGLFLTGFTLSRSPQQAGLILIGGLLSGLGFLLLSGVEWTPLYQNLVLGVQNGIQPQFLLDVLSSELQILWILGTISLYGLVPRKQWKDRWLWSGTFFFLFVGLGSLLKHASGLNYLLEFKIFLLASLGVLARRSIRWEGLVSALLLVLTLGTIVIKGKEWKDRLSDIYINDPVLYSRSKEIAEWMREYTPLQDGEYYYVEDESWLKHFFPTRSMLPIRSTVGEILKVTDHPFDYQPLTKTFDEGKVPYVICQDPKTCGILLPTVSMQSYEKWGNHLGYTIYRHQSMTEN